MTALVDFCFSARAGKTSMVRLAAALAGQPLVEHKSWSINGGLQW